jgi:signal-transduction protein with cAMP-binding, CBS, and nucleotidyltransferase domain
MKVKDIMHSVVRIPDDMLVSEAAKKMDKESIGSVLIEKNDRMIGIMTERDILRKVVAKGGNPEKMKVSEVMNCPLITVDHETDIHSASRIMDEKRIRRLIVTREGEIVGKVTANSISRNLRYIYARKPDEYVRPEF